MVETELKKYILPQDINVASYVNNNPKATGYVIYDYLFN